MIARGQLEAVCHAAWLAHRGGDPIGARRGSTFEDLLGAFFGQSSEERAERVSILLHRDVHRLDLRLDERAMLRDGLLELPAAILDPAIRLRSDSPDLLLAPGMDKNHVVVGALLERLGFRGGSGVDLPDLCRLLLAHADMDPLTFAVRGGLHGAGELVQERRDGGRPRNHGRGGVGGGVPRIECVRLEVGVHPGYLKEGAESTPRLREWQSRRADFRCLRETGSDQMGGPTGSASSPGRSRPAHASGTGRCVRRGARSSGIR